MNNVNDSWEKFLHPETLRGNLLVISLFITAFEIFKERVIEKPETFFTNGFNEKGMLVSKKYETEVLSLSKSRLYASLLWLKEMGAVDDADIKSFDEIRKHRNEVTHELIDFLSNINKNFDHMKFKALIDLLAKIENWWLLNFEIAIDPDMIPDGAKPEDVVSGTMMSLKLLLSIALGTEPEEGYYYNSFKKIKT